MYAFLLFLKFWKIISTIYTSQFDTISVSGVNKTHIYRAHKYVQSCVNDSVFILSLVVIYARLRVVYLISLVLLDFFIDTVFKHWSKDVCSFKNPHNRYHRDSCNVVLVGVCISIWLLISSVYLSTKCCRCSTWAVMFAIHSWGCSKFEPQALSNNIHYYAVFWACYHVLYLGVISDSCSHMFMLWSIFQVEFDIVIAIYWYLNVLIILFQS